MKKALLLGVMAFFAINLATVQTSTAQGLVKGQKSDDELKIEKEKNQFTTTGTSNLNEAKTAGKDVNAINANTNTDVEKAPVTKIRDGKAAPSQAAAEKAPAKIRAPRRNHANVSNNRNMAGSNNIAPSSSNAIGKPGVKQDPTKKNPTLNSVRPKAGNDPKVEGKSQEVKKTTDK